MASYSTLRDGRSEIESGARAFENSKNVHVLNSNINVAGRDINNYYLQTSPSIGLKQLEQYICPTAFVSSILHKKCADSTRQRVFYKIRDWKERVTSTEDNSVPRVLWMFGPAGCGKSSVMHTLTISYKENKTLYASFFFARDHENEKQNTAEYFIATIAYQLATMIPGFGKLVEEIIKGDPYFYLKSLQDQFALLIKEPATKLKEGATELSGDEPRALVSLSKVVILIDALDECINEDHQAQIIKLAHLASASLNLNFVISSRQDVNIKNVFEDLELSSGPCPLLKIDIYHDEETYSDIGRYLKGELSNICKKFRLPVLWPSENDTDLLIKQANGLFVYAAAAINYVGMRGHYPPNSLKEILQNQTGSTFTSDLDRIYKQTFQSHPNLRKLMRIFKVLVHLQNIESFQTVYHGNLALIASILGYDQHECTVILEELGSLVYISDGVIKFYHTLLSDFLKNESRAKELYVNDSPHEVIDWCIHSLIQGCTDFNAVLSYHFKAVLVIPQDASRDVLEYGVLELSGDDDEYDISQVTSRFNIFGNFSIVLGENWSKITYRKSSILLENRPTSYISLFENADRCSFEESSFHLKPANHGDDDAFETISVDDWASHKFKWSGSDALRTDLWRGRLFSSAKRTTIRDTTILLGCLRENHCILNNSDSCDLENSNIKLCINRAATFNDISGDFEVAKELVISIFENALKFFITSVNLNIYDCTTAQETLLSKIATITVLEKAVKPTIHGVQITCFSPYETRVDVLGNSTKCDIENTTLKLCASEVRLLHASTEEYAYIKSSMVYQMAKTEDFDLQESFKFNTNPEFTSEGIDEFKCKLTLTGILQLASRWTRLFDASTRIMWLAGPSEEIQRYVMQSILNSVTTDAFLAASFSIGRTEMPESIYHLFPSVAYQLARNIPLLRKQITASLMQYTEENITEHNPVHLQSQFQQLILEPIRAMNISHALRARIILIHIAHNSDCYEEWKELMQIIVRGILHFDLPFRFLISFPDTFPELPVEIRASQVSEYIYVGDSSDDDNMKSYFTFAIKHKGIPPLYDAGRTTNKASRGCNWEFLCAPILRSLTFGVKNKGRPSSPDAARTTANVASLACNWDYLYASILVRFIAQHREAAFRHLESENQLLLSNSEENEHSRLDRLFTAILVSHPRSTQAQKMLKTIIYLPEVKFYMTRHHVTIPIVEGILGLQEGEGIQIMRRLGPIAYLHDNNKRVGLYDPRFTEFLKDPQRSGNFYIGGQQGAIEVSQWCFDSFVNWKTYSRTPRPQTAHLNRLRTVLGNSAENNDWIYNDTRRHV